MSRQIVELDSLKGVAEDALLNSAVRLVFMSPRRGGPRVTDIRSELAPRGRVRLSGTALRLFADFDPGPPEQPLIALETIARSDAAGLERMILSALPHVDEIVLGVDARSDEDTLRVAQAYGDSVYVFAAPDIGLSEEEWAADRIHFANARNIGRSRVLSPWVLVADSDEYVAHVGGDLREQLRQVASEGCETKFKIGAMVYDDHQRLARAHLRWVSGTHNQLIHTGVDHPVDVIVAEDKKLRAEAENARRDSQRHNGIEELVAEAEQGNLMALFHLVKHRAHHGDIVEACKLAEDYRSRIEPHTVLREERAWAALCIAFRYYQGDNLIEADRWAVRALLDGPCTVAFCMLGDIAEDQGDLERARGWYECACAYTESAKITWPALTELRFGRLAGISKAIVNPEAASTINVIETDTPPDEATSRST